MKSFSCVFLMMLVCCCRIRAGQVKNDGESDTGQNRISSSIQSVNLIKQMACYQGMSWNIFDLLKLGTKYISYGCYCGIGGKGKPKDSIDRCCQAHDRCFGGVTKASNSLTEVMIFEPYEFVCAQNQRKTFCRSAGVTTAGKGLCECDRRLSYCVARYKRVFNNNYSGGRVRSTC
ncbi:acidic phospholipase A2 CM-II-like [Clavelina lepadiformis]|uniref:acidic phospholipase A2 CM-II-like n=1 Tax=Clavelina lepadiformis TaxID=159417 RepID=UPI004041F79D